MAKHLFKVTGSNGPIAIGEVERETYPAPGDILTIFNFPIISRYVVLTLEPRADALPIDWFEPQQLVLDLVEELERVGESKVVALKPTQGILRRLQDVVKVAKATISSKLRLEISRADFAELCEASGLSSDVSTYDAIAYYDIPVGVGGDGEEWNASTCFTGHSDEMHVYYVTLPGGEPFVMNRRLLDVASALWNGYISSDQAFDMALKACFERGTGDSEALRFALRQTLELILEGLTPLYDGAQELTRLSVCSQVKALERAWQASQASEVVMANVHVGDGTDFGRRIDFDFTRLCVQPGE